MKKILILSAIVTAFSAQSYASEEGLSVVGLDQTHQEMNLTLSSEQYAETLSAIVSNVNDSTLSALQAKERAAQDSSYWMLRDVVVGIGLSFTAGLGPIYHISAAPRIRFCFSNSTHPKIPD